MALQGRRKLVPRVVSSHWHTWEAGMASRTGMCSPPAQPTPGRERTHSVYLESCLQMSLGRGMTGETPTTRPGNLSNMREEKDWLEISSAICRLKLLNCFKISFTYSMNLFNKSFHCRYSKGKCHPNPHGITSNSNIWGQQSVYINHVLLYFRKKIPEWSLLP